MAYGLGATTPQRFAAIAPQYGSFHRGFLDSPNPLFGVPMMDVHGSNDLTVPANLTSFNMGDDVSYPLSADGWYYTQIQEITSAWADANDCSGDAIHYPTSLDGVNDL